MGCRNQKVALAFGFLACRDFIATDFALRVLVGRVTPCAPHIRRAENCSPYPSWVIVDVVGTPRRGVGSAQRGDPINDQT
jgi:hypothetical protein